ncbi:MAG: aldo/keto reductase [Planctomycetia bacterium]|nr:aldo/keto reductase [Planctomycetia bacterium]
MTAPAAFADIPAFLYGTAWKEDDTERLTALALEAGFRGIDTANQRKHYHEAGVGAALAAAFANGTLARKDVFLQTKFTFRGGQDHRLPYDPGAPVPMQVEQSFAQSLAHLGVSTIDSYVLHGPSTRDGLAPADWDAWRAMERIHDSGKVHWLGVSNVDLDQLVALCDGARVRPRFVQNRCFAVHGWDRDVRRICQKNGMIYQGFSLLTANGAVLGSATIRDMAHRYGKTPEQIVFRFALDVGMLPLTGTTSRGHMLADLAVGSFRLSPEEVAAIERLKR